VEREQPFNFENRRRVNLLRHRDKSYSLTSYSKRLVSKSADVVNDPRCIQFEITMVARNVDSAAVTGRCIGDTILLGLTSALISERA